MITKFGTINIELGDMMGRAKCGVRKSLSAVGDHGVATAMELGLKQVCRGAAYVVLAVVLGGCPLFDLHVPVSENIAQEWMALTLDALEQDSWMPTVEARTLWHVSATMYEAWAAYDPVATGYFTGDDYDPSSEASLKSRAETLSHASFSRYF